MLPKKDPNIDLEKHRILFFKIGLIGALLITLVALEWSGSTAAISYYSMADADIEVEYLPPNTVTKKEIPKPKMQNFKIFQTDDFSENEEFEPVDNGMESNDVIGFNLLEPEESNDKDIIIHFPPVSPEFPGGEKNLRKFIAHNINYPQMAIENQIEGKVFVRFVINYNGEIKNTKVIRSIDSLLDNEALRVVNLLPKWKPGLNNGKPINVSYTLPVTFRLQ